MRIDEEVSQNNLENNSPDMALNATKALSELTAAKVSQIVKSGKAREYFSINDVIHLHGIELEVIGFDHDISVGAPGTSTMTLMSKTLIPARRMHGKACERGWIDTELRKWLNERFIDELPAGLVEQICLVNKTTHNYKGEVFTTIDRLLIPSESEMFGSAIYSSYEDGPRYEAFATSEIRIRKDKGYTSGYWTRSAIRGHLSPSYFATVRSGGDAFQYIASNDTTCVPLCFVIA